MTCSCYPKDPKTGHSDTCAAWPEPKTMGEYEASRPRFSIFDEESDVPEHMFDFLRRYRKMPSKYVNPPDLSRATYLIGFYSASGYSGGVSSPGFYMIQNFRQPYYSYDEAVAAAHKILASNEAKEHDRKEVFIYRLQSKVELEPVKPPVRVIDLPHYPVDYKPGLPSNAR